MSEVPCRLLALNFERYADEQRLGVVGGKRTARKTDHLHRPRPWTTMIRMPNRRIGCTCGMTDR
ncbi:MAG: hypothetical protein U0670_14240 [Anaerolineae bacterium]